MPVVPVAVVQMSSQADLAANLDRVAALVDRAAARGARLVLLPENFALMGDESARLRIAEDLSGDGPILAALRRAAKDAGVAVIGGGMPERSDEPGRPFNTSVVIDPTGEVVSRYRKIHLFDVEVGDGVAYRESSATSAGGEPEVARLPGLPPIGLSVCYDLRFPELYRALVDAGAELLTVPAAFTLATGKDHWHVLLRARAIEAQCYVLAAAQWGTHPGGRRTYGKACVVDPWGDVVAQVPEGEGVAIAEIDPTRIDAVRRDLPSLRHRRLGRP